jgi:hypothetical protein
MIWYLVLEGACVGAFVGGFFVTRGKRRVAAAVMFVLMCALVVKAYLHWHPVTEATLFPWRDYIYLQGYWLFLIAAGFCGIAASQLDAEPNRNKRNALLVFGVLLVVYGGIRHLWMVVPQNHGKNVYAGKDHHCPQSTIYTCAPSACVSAASYFDISVNEREMAERCLTSSLGTNVFNVYRGLSLTMPENQYSVKIRNVSVVDLCKEGVVAVSTWPSLNHAICTVGRGNEVRVHDPLKDKPLLWSKQKLEKHFGGVAVVIEKK